MINKILFVTLSNIGDCILTLPVLDALISNFPKSKITVICGKRPLEIFQNNPHIYKTIRYDKAASLKNKAGLILSLKKERFDLIVDMRNSAIPVLFNAKYRTSPFIRIPDGLYHMKDRHFFRFKKIFPEISLSEKKSALFIDKDTEDSVKRILSDNSLKEDDKLIIIAPSARSHIKRWRKEGFIKLSSELGKSGLKVILVGDKEDLPLCNEVEEETEPRPVNLCAKTTLKQLAAVINRGVLVITNDSAVMHLGSYLDIPVLAIFGPTDPKKYGPWNDKSRFLQKELFCAPCEKSICGYKHECMQLLSEDEVIKAAKELLRI